MAFLKLRCERAYATGAVRTMLNPREFAGKLTRLGFSARVEGDIVYVKAPAGSGEIFGFSHWSQNGLEYTGWLLFTTNSVTALSDTLARAGVAHRFEWSRPFDLTTDDVRCVTSYDYNWSAPTTGRGRAATTIKTYDEPVPV